MTIDSRRIKVKVFKDGLTFTTDSKIISTLVTLLQNSTKCLVFVIASLSSSFSGISGYEQVSSKLPYVMFVVSKCLDVFKNASIANP